MFYFRMNKQFFQGVSTTCIRQFNERVQFKRVPWLSNKTTKVEYGLSKVLRIHIKTAFTLCKNFLIHLVARKQKHNFFCPNTLGSLNNFILNKQP